mmetsp:Transcript_16038/g.26903  ORF Transcript_16038/g.26903 Transcript_16038/m.26903 type:complete len:381 (+) Transcript_16038:45-1187(+)
MDSREDPFECLGICLVIGGSGWTGSNLVSQLVQLRDDSHTATFAVHSLDIVPPSHAFQNLHIGEDSFIRCDITDAEAVNKVFQQLRPQSVFHTASIVDLRRYPPPLIDQVNVHGTQHLVQALRNVSSTTDQVSCFVYTSTFDVVCEKHGVSRADESYPLLSDPSNAYKRTKIAAERYVTQSASDTLLTVALRSGHIFGPGDKLLPLATAAPAALGPSSARMSVTYVENLAAAHILAALVLYRERQAAAASDGEEVNGSAFFVTDADVNFHDFYKRLAMKGPCLIRIPLFFMKAIIALVEFMEWLCFVLLGAWYVKHQLQHPVTGVTSAMLESGGQLTAVSDRARRVLGYGSRAHTRGGVCYVDVDEAVLRTARSMAPQEK